MTWEEYLKSKGVSLLDWQNEAAYAFLSVLQKKAFCHRCGKTFLLKILSTYVNEHGNDMSSKDGGAA